jgi:hypothetical protein
MVLGKASNIKVPYQDVARSCQETPHSTVNTGPSSPGSESRDDQATQNGRARPRPGYTAEAFIEMADYLEAIAQDSCHPALFVNRLRAATTLRRMATAPDNPPYRAVLDTVRFTAYLSIE